MPLAERHHSVSAHFAKKVLQKKIFPNAAASASSKLPVHACPKDMHRAAITVIGRIHRKLVVKSNVQPGGHGNVIVGLDDFFSAVETEVQDWG